MFRFLRKSESSSRPRAICRRVKNQGRLRYEGLEARFMLATTTIWLDFGQGLIDQAGQFGTLATTVGALRDINSDPDDNSATATTAEERFRTGPDLSCTSDENQYANCLFKYIGGTLYGSEVQVDEHNVVVVDSTLEFRPYSFDMDDDQILTATDVTLLAEAVRDRVAASMLPFNVDVKLASANTLVAADVTLRSNALTHDAYVFVMDGTVELFSSSGATQTIRFDDPLLNVQGPTVNMKFNGASAAKDISVAGLDNNFDEAAIVFPSGYMSGILSRQTEVTTDDLDLTNPAHLPIIREELVARIARTAIHEAFHTFSFEHFDVREGDGRWAGNVVALSETYEQRAERAVLYRSEFPTTGTLPFHYSQAVDLLGKRPGVEYFTGTGLHDVVSIVPVGTGTNLATVTITPYSDPDHSQPVVSYGGLGAAQHTISYDANTIILVDTGLGNDYVTVTGQFALDHPKPSLQIRGGAGDDEVEVSATGFTSITVEGDEGNDSILVQPIGGNGINAVNTFLFGGSGNDTLTSGVGNDFVYGGLGNDILTSGSGMDFLDAGLGINILQPGAGKNIIVGSATGVTSRDTITLAASSTATYTVNDNSFTPILDFEMSASGTATLEVDRSDPSALSLRQTLGNIDYVRFPVIANPTTFTLDAGTQGLTQFESNSGRRHSYLEPSQAKLSIVIAAGKVTFQSDHDLSSLTFPSGSTGTAEIGEGPQGLSHMVRLHGMTYADVSVPGYKPKVVLGPGVGTSTQAIRFATLNDPLRPHSYVAIREARSGDANLDGAVDRFDKGIIDQNLFGVGIKDWGHGNFNSDTTVDGSDFNIWNANRTATENLDALFAAARAGTFDNTYDFYDDNVLNLQDRDAYLANNPGSLGDVNFDNLVDIVDFEVLRRYLYSGSTQNPNGWAQGDFNGDGVTDGTDFNIWMANRTISGGSGAPTLGDLNGDGLLSGLDIDLLRTGIEVVAASAPGSQTNLLAIYDMNTDGTITNADLDHWIHVLKGTEYGDVNLDFKVNSADIVIWLANRNKYVTTWSGGDLNGDGYVNMEDLSIINANYGFGT